MLGFRVVRTLRTAVVSALVCGALGLAAEAQAAYTARVVGETLRITGNSASDDVTLRRGGSPGRLVVDVGDNGTADFTFARSAFRRIVVEAGAGNDGVGVDEVNGSFTDTEKTTIIGGSGNDSLTGGSFAETLVGGRSADDITSGDGHDVLTWRLGDGSDSVDGGAGVDQIVMTGSSAAQDFHVSPGAAAGHIDVSINAGATVLDLLAVNLIKIDARRGDDTLSGADGLATLAGLELVGGSGADTITSGDSDDIVRAGVGDSLVVAGGGTDRMFWKGAGSASLDGGTGDDVLRVRGSAAADTFGVAANGSRVSLTINPGAGALDIGTTEDLVLLGGRGGDTVSTTGNLAALVALTLDGGEGADAIGGSNGADVILSGPGADTVDGKQANDVVFTQDGDDVAIWRPGDGSDTLEGMDGNDVLLFNGSAGSETFDLSANGQRFRLFRDLGTITMDVDDFEGLHLDALGGTDALTVHNLGPTDLQNVTIDLEGVLDTGSGDGMADSAIAAGRTTGDTIEVRPLAEGARILGLGARINVLHPEPANDQISVQGLGGGDRLSALDGLVSIIRLVLEGGDGGDRLFGGDGDDGLVGGANDDVLSGRAGNDSLTGGTGFDTFNCGDGSDTVVDPEAGEPVAANCP
jgi:Ca2+-binding RTX toxin-like protein